MQSGAVHAGVMGNRRCGLDLDRVGTGCRGGVDDGQARSSREGGVAGPAISTGDDEGAAVGADRALRRMVKAVNGSWAREFEVSRVHMVAQR